MPGSSAGPGSIEQFLVVDSWPVMEWLKQREPVASAFRKIVAAAQNSDVTLLLSTINLGEIYYNSWNEWGQARAERILAEMSDLPIRLVHPTAEDALAAAKIKARFKLAYADAFAAILALEFQAPVLTGDRDFLRVLDGGLISVRWIGA